MLLQPGSSNKPGLNYKHAELYVWYYKFVLDFKICVGLSRCVKHSKAYVQYVTTVGYMHVRL